MPGAFNPGLTCVVETARCVCCRLRGPPGPAPLATMRQSSIRSVAVGLLVGTLMCFTNMYFGARSKLLQAGVVPQTLRLRAVISQSIPLCLTQAILLVLEDL